LINTLLSYVFYSPNGTAFQTDFDAMGMCWGFCQDVFDNSFGEFSRSLILFQDDEDSKAWFYIASV